MIDDEFDDANATVHGYSLLRLRLICTLTTYLLEFTILLARRDHKSFLRVMCSKLKQPRFAVSVGTCLLLGCFPTQDTRYASGVCYSSLRMHCLRYLCSRYTNIYSLSTSSI